MDPKKVLPKFDELPSFHNFKGCAWAVWGPDDQLGTVNLLTDDLVAQTAREEIRLTLSKSFSIPWDGLRHFGVLEHGVFYNNTPATSIALGLKSFADPLNVDPEQIKLGIHNWADHGICGRGVLLDLVNYFIADGSSLPYDPISAHSVSVEQLEACAKKQGIQFRQGDILILRVGFIQKYYALSQTEKDGLASRPETFAGLEQSEHMKRFLWKALSQPGVRACLTFTSIQSLILARSAFHNSFTYRSCVVFGTASLIDDSEPEHKLEALKAITNHPFKNLDLPPEQRDRWDDSRAPTETELKSTRVVEVTLEMASAKVTFEGPEDDKKDLADSDVAKRYWAGEVVRKTGWGGVKYSGVDVSAPVPGYVEELIAKGLHLS
ncbi:hypothetical protein HWV62_35528 [Athelia sp. TMB]|nr:hypothetical protein HWV62_13150 [Athelia sp. TMB]KAF7981059.1 hypothetical protein HWV62_35528 [Athelia sp. TMB]